ncbi:hypothetical protein ACOI1C_08310 [Bacillus sp. DJP31]|uniref:hypothetical protein n=1 Tax=Bacillus sp. DJP31 TaxID=3409789 RepID=UPI003BB5A5EC
MGYILPITQFQYIQYANRMLKSTKSPFVINSVVKATMEKKLNDEHRESHEFIEVASNLTRSARKKNTLIQASAMNYHLLSEITGKGRHINEYI